MTSSVPVRLLWLMFSKLWIERRSTEKQKNMISIYLSIAMDLRTDDYKYVRVFIIDQQGHILIYLSNIFFDVSLFFSYVFAVFLSSLYISFDSIFFPVVSNYFLYYDRQILLYVILFFLIFNTIILHCAIIGFLFFHLQGRTWNFLFYNKFFIYQLIYIFCFLLLFFIFKFVFRVKSVCLLHYWLTTNGICQIWN